jgi:GNAT superfamily N-acetyltransferase
MVDDHVTDVTTWTLEMTSPDQLRPGREPTGDDVRITRAHEPSPEYSRFLYTAVGGDWYWLDRLSWDRDRWMAWLDRPALATWTLVVRGTPAGYVELEAQPQGDVEIAYFGLVRGFTGRGLGGYLLSEGIRRAWARGSEWAHDTGPAKRVWVHTCTLDGPHALANYRARGMRIVAEITEPLVLPPAPPCPWPGHTR